MIRASWVGEGKGDTQIERVRALGSIAEVLGKIEGINEMMIQSNQTAEDVERQMNHIEAIYRSMSAAERQTPALLDGQRLLRIRKGAGVEDSEVDRFIADFERTKQVMQTIGRHGIET